jgi:hypothetical protein
LAFGLLFLVAFDTFDEECKFKTKRSTQLSGFSKGGEAMAEEHETRQPYKCAVCGAKFGSQDQLQNHLKSCTQKKSQ